MKNNTNEIIKWINKKARETKNEDWFENGFDFPDYAGLPAKYRKSLYKNTVFAIQKAWDYTRTGSSKLHMKIDEAGIKHIATIKRWDGKIFRKYLEGYEI